MYRFRSLIAAVFATAFVLTSAPLAGQSYQNAIGLIGGGTWSSQMAPGTIMDPRLSPNWNVGLEVERWLGAGRIGVRLGGSFSETQVTDAGTQMKLYTGDASLLLRLLSPRPGRVVAPFISIGAGAMQYNTTDPTPFIVGDVLLEMDPTARPGVMGGVGIDLSPTTGLGLRLEGVDRLAIQSPFVDGAGDAFDPVHHVRYSASIQVRFGRLGGQDPVFAAATPAEAPPEPTEAPEPEQTTEPEQAAEPEAEAEPIPGDEPVSSAGGEPMAPDTTEATPEPTPTPPAMTVEPVSQTNAAAERTTDEGAVAAAGGVAAQMFTVQIAAYEHSESAWKLAERIYADDLPAWVTRIERGDRVYHRVRVGVVPNETEARLLGRRLRTEYQTPVWVVRVEPSASVSAEAVAATRAFMRGS